MTIARQIADLVDTSGDVKLTNLDNVPPSDWNTLLNLPAHANVDHTVATNITSGTLNHERMGSGNVAPTYGQYLRGDGQWVSNCTNHSNCTTNGNGKANCATNGNGKANCNNSSGNCTNHGNCSNCNHACNCACACACNC